MGHLLKKDFRRLLKQPVGFFLLIALPVTMASLISMAFGNAGNQVMPHVILAIEDHDRSLVSDLLKGAFQRGQLADIFTLEEFEPGEGREVIEKDKASALLIIPKGFADSLLHQRPTQLTLLKNPGQAFGPKICEETVTILGEAGDRIVRIGEGPLNILQNEMDQTEIKDQSIAEMAVLINQIMRNGGALIFDPLITLEEQTLQSGTRNNRATLFTISLTGIATMSLFFVLNGLAIDYFRERESFTLYRILASPLTKMSYTLAKWLYLVILGTVSLLIVWVLAVTFWNMPITFSQILPLLLMTFLVSTSTAGIISLLYAVFRTRGQASAIAPAIIIFFSIIGGGMIPIQSLPAIFKHIAILSPVYWGVTGFQRILLNQSDLSQLVLPYVLLLVISLTTVILSLFFQQRKIAV